MSDGADPAAPGPSEHGELVSSPDAETEAFPSGDAVTSPAKVMRIGSMVKMLLEEVRAAPLDEPSRERLAEIYERSVAELSEALSPDLQHELKMLALPFRDGEVPSEAQANAAAAIDQPPAGLGRRLAERVGRLGIGRVGGLGGAAEQADGRAVERQERNGGQGHGASKKTNRRPGHGQTDGAQANTGSSRWVASPIS